MKKTDEFELKILRELVAKGDNGKGGIPMRLAKHLFYNTVGSIEEGEEFHSRMLHDDFITFEVKNKEYSDEETGKNVFEQFWYFPTGRGGFRLKDLESVYEQEEESRKVAIKGLRWSVRAGRAGMVAAAAAVFGIPLAIYFGTHPAPSTKEFNPFTDTTSLNRQMDSLKQLMKDSDVQIVDTSFYADSDSLAKVLNDAESLRAAHDLDSFKKLKHPTKKARTPKVIMYH